MKNGLSRKLRVAIAILFFLLVVVSLALIAIQAIFLIQKYVCNPLNITHEERNYYDYKHYKMNPLTNEKFFGMTTTITEIDGDFHMFVDESGNLNLVSKFGTEEYQCTGSCHCIEVDEGDDFFSSQRRAGTAVVRGLHYLVASVSVVLAANIARSYFESECISILEDSCPLNAIQSEVEECENVVDSEEKSTELSPQTETESKTEMEIEGKRQRYICKGSCAFTGITKSESWGVSVFNFWQYSLVEKSKWFKLIKRFSPPPHGLGACSYIHVENEVSSTKGADVAAHMFAVDELDPHCRSASRVMFRKNVLNPWKSKPYEKCFCVGVLLSEDGNVLLPRSVVCREV